MPTTPEQVAADNQREAARRAAEDAKLTPEEKEARLAEARAARDAIDTDSVPRSEVHTYADGSQRVGVPPFPELSPVQEAESKLERVGAPPAPPMVVPPGMPTSGAPAPAPVGGITTEQLAAKAQQQLDSDVMAGKSANTPNPTTDSNKPELAGTAGEEIPVEPTKEELEAIAQQIQPTGEGATEEQKNAAVTQVLRETSGPIVEGDDSKEKKTTKKSGK